MFTAVDFPILARRTPPYQVCSSSRVEFKGRNIDELLLCVENIPHNKLPDFVLVVTHFVIPACADLALCARLCVYVSVMNVYPK